MVVAMMRGALVWLSTIWWRRASALDLGSKVVWHGAAPKKCNGSKRGEHFHGGGETHGLHFGFEDDGHGVHYKETVAKLTKHVRIKVS